jgi:hypothetical protein
MMPIITWAMLVDDLLSDLPIPDVAEHFERADRI